MQARNTGCIWNFGCSCYGKKNSMWQSPACDTAHILCISDHRCPKTLTWACIILKNHLPLLMYLSLTRHPPSQSIYPIDVPTPSHAHPSRVADMTGGAPPSYPWWLPLASTHHHGSRLFLSPPYPSKSVVRASGVDRADGTLDPSRSQDPP